MIRRSPLGPTLVALGVIYAGLVLSIPAEGFFQPQEGILWLQTESLVRSFWTSAAIRPPGAALDPEGRFLPPGLAVIKGEVRAQRASIQPLLSSVPYVVLGTPGLYLLPALAALVALAAAWRLAFLAIPAHAALAGMAAILLSPIVLFGATTMPYTLAGALVLAALIPLRKSVLMSAPGDPWRLSVSAGMLIGLAAAVRLEMAFIGLLTISIGLAVWRWRRAARQAAGLMAGALAVLLPRALYHRLASGVWFDELRAPRGLDWVALAVPAIPVLVIAAIWWSAQRWQAPPRRLAGALWGLVLVGALAQGLALRHVATQRRLHAQMVSRVRAAAGEQGVVLSDAADASRLLMPVASAAPALYVRPNMLSALSDRIRDAAVTPFWITRKLQKSDRLERPSALMVRAALRRDAAVDLGDGFVLLRYDFEGGVRGFARMPMGD